MARATTVAGVVIAGILALAGARDGQAAPMGQSGQPSRLRVALDSANDCARQGDFRQAAYFLQQAQEARDELSPDDQQHLAHLVQLNDQALQAQRQGTEQVRKAETAVNLGNAQEAEAILKGLGTNRFLSTADQLKVQQLSERLARRGAPAAAGAPAGQPLTSFFSQNANAPRKQLPEPIPEGRDGAELLRDARAALQRGELDRARQLAQEAQRRGSWGFRLWGDSPAKVLKEVEIAQGEMAAFGDNRPGDGKGADPRAADEARRLVSQGRKALQNGDAARARQLALQAKAQKVEFNWWDVDSPDKLLADAQRVAGDGGPAPLPPPDAKEDPRALLKKGRELYTAGRYDEADEVATRAAADTSVRWGLFGDSPDKLKLDLHRARAYRDQKESARLLAEARRQFDQGNLEGAKDLAVRAHHLHGPYSLLESGGPAKLIAEIEAAEAKRPSRRLPPNDVAPPPAPLAGGPPAEPTRPLPPAQPDVPPVFQARQLLAEARQLQAAGRLTEAREKALAAQKANAAFGPDEDRPERVLLALSGQAKKEIDGRLEKAKSLTATGFIDPSRYAAAEAELAQARQLVVVFGLDAQPVEAVAAWTRQERDKTQAATAPRPAPAPLVDNTPPPANAQQARGQELLKNARMELRRGETGIARRLAEDAYTGKYGVQDEAATVLRCVDAEEAEQQRLAANRTFEAGLSAFRRKDYVQAGNIFRAVDARLLNPDKQARLRDLVLSPELQPAEAPRLDPKVAQAGHSGPGTARVTDQIGAAPRPEAAATPGYAQQVQALQDVQFQKLRLESLEVQREATKAFQDGDADRALDMLKDYLAGLSDAQLDPSRLALLRRSVDARLNQLKMLKAQRDFAAQENGTRDAFNSKKTREALQEENKHKQVAELMKQYTTFYGQADYRKAEMYAMQALEVDPDNTAAAAGVQLSRMQQNATDAQHRKEGRADLFLKEMNDTEEQGPPLTSRDPLRYDKDAFERAKNRKGLPPNGIEINTEGAKAREIKRRLLAPVTIGAVKDTTLRQVIDDLRAQVPEFPIVPDQAALADEGINLDLPMNIPPLTNISLKSALNLILEQAHLTWVVRDEALKITTQANAKGKCELRTYQVVDLVVPIDNHTVAPMYNLEAMLDKVVASQGVKTPESPLGRNLRTLPGGVPTTAPLPNGITPTVMDAEAPRAPGQPMQDLLIKLITSAVAPQSWNAMGGPGTVDYYPLGYALVINQTPDIQEQVAELLTALRRLQDLEVAVEVRFITLSEAFYERIGLDFDVNIQNRSPRNESLLTSQQFTPAGQINAFRPVGNFVSGLTPAGTFTSDLNIPIRSSSFEPAVPPFGGFGQMPGGNGGLSLGLAFLSDIQVFLFMEAAQADRRTNVMQAPKLTLFNGQTSNITINELQFFVIGVTVAIVGGQLSFTPLNMPLPVGPLSLTIQAVVSADRRYVRLNMAPQLMQMATATTALFPITTFITPVFEGGAQGQPVPFTQFLQMPNITNVSVNTTVSVPDGGTVLMGGLKTLREGRNEFGPPILSKIPYVNRLFKNVGYGREAESLLLMVTPRIIINEEEELVQTQNLRTGGPASTGGP